ncbi:hypothetical protein Taro_029028 [Colocasia esculenta]|uniref:Uncharacterized protein n=1 Tax=Colocasia esculenta TaxID=4460 RepID=A0A843VZ21_COLES|nr:hypothetical protein [Colocasia esculenta]
MSPFHSTVPPPPGEIRHDQCLSTASSLLRRPLLYLFFFFFSLPYPSHSQRPYVDNKQLDCYGTNDSSTLGYTCSSSDSLTCPSFLTFRSQADYQTATAIGNLLNADPAAIARINNVNDVNGAIAINDLVVVPVDCSCSRAGGPWYYQHSGRYVLKYTGETYLLLANETYQGLSTCQALMAQNPSPDSLNLTVGAVITVPLRCACPYKNQLRADGVKYLLSYLITWNDDISSIAQRFNVSTQSVIDANNLTADGNIIYPFTTVLVPLFTEPTNSVTLYSPSPRRQPYVNNKQLDCYGTNASSTLGYSCNASSPSCSSFLTFRSQTNYQSPVTIGYLLKAAPAAIARINGVNDVQTIPINTLVIVPIDCSCSRADGQYYYQHYASYTLKYTGETYLLLANDTYQGLSTCQALMAQNPSHESRNITQGMNITVPLRCACPSQKQAASGVKYLLSYLVAWEDDVDGIAQRFNVSAQSVLDANNLAEDDNIFPFTNVLVPLLAEPTKGETQSPPPPPPPPTGTPSGGGGSNKRWVFVGVGIGAGVSLFLIFVLAWFFCRRRRDSPSPENGGKGNNFNFSESVEHGSLSGKTLPPTALAASSSFSGKIRNVVESLTVYTFEELERATDSFAEGHRIKGSVYHASINGDDAAVKRLKGDVSNEINILKQINHSNVMRLSGFCLHEGDTYLVYEFAENGSLSDWIHHHDQRKDWKDGGSLDWKQRVRIACDVADGLNYLHNYANPPFIHKDLKSSNILLDSMLRAKVANFGLARSVEGGEGAVQLTRHVVGTQGYMAPEYLEHGLITPKLDVFAFGVVLLELLSGKEALYTKAGGVKMECLLWATIRDLLSGENVREKLKSFMDPCLRDEYPFDLAFAISQLAMHCVAEDPNARPTIGEALVSLTAIYSSSLDWDPSDPPETDSMVHSR